MQKNRFLNFLPYLIVVIAIISLFSMNMNGASRPLSYNELQDTLKQQKVEDSVLSVGSNVVVVKGTYKLDGKSVG